MTTSGAGEADWPDACTTCGRPYSKDDAESGHCSNAFHLCRDCAWEDGFLVGPCRDHDVEPPPEPTWAPCSVCKVVQVPASDGIDTCGACSGSEEPRRDAARAALKRLEANMRAAALEAQRRGAGVPHAVVGSWVRRVGSALEALEREAASSRNGFKAMADATGYFAARQRAASDKAEKNWRLYFEALDRLESAKQALEDYGQHLVGTGPAGPCPKALSHDPAAICNCGFDEAISAIRRKA